MVRWPRCGMEYDSDGPILSQVHELAGELWPIWDVSPITCDHRFGELFDALFRVREVCIAIGGGWQEADLVRFAFEKTSLMPQWARDIPVPTIQAVVDYLEAARRRFIAITHLVQWTGCFGDRLRTPRAIDRYIGKKPSRTPDCLGWTPRQGHWSTERASKRVGIRDKLGVLMEPSHGDILTESTVSDRSGWPWAPFWAPFGGTSHDDICLCDVGLRSGSPDSTEQNPPGFGVSPFNGPIADLSPDAEPDQIELLNATTQF